MSDAPVVIDAHPSPDDVRALEHRIYEFNVARTGIVDGELLSAFERDGSGRIVAGIFGWTWGGCCEIRSLWVDESLRGRGHGTRLIAAGEDEARRRGCSQLVLATHDFQAPAFYAKRGYTLLAAIEGYPKGHRQLLMRKILAPHD